jgi:hypothetical protein
MSVKIHHKVYQKKLKAEKRLNFKKSSFTESNLFENSKEDKINNQCNLLVLSLTKI